MRTLGIIATLTMFAASTAACGPTAPSAEVTSTPTDTSPAAPPSPTVDRRAELKAMVDAAGLKPKDLGVKKADSEDTILKVTMPCGNALIAGHMAAHHWGYKATKPAVVSHNAFAYDPERGAAVIDQVRAALTTCKTWIWGGTWDMKVVGEFVVSRPAGVDNAVAYCHYGTILKGASKGDKAYLCDGFVSRGNLVAQIGTLELTAAEARAELKKALPLAAAALVRAVPEP